ncbi:MAG: hypothetical protein ACK4NF_05215, partial [Planctomycetota bacterium]
TQKKAPAKKEEKELLKSYEDLPYIFTDGGFSDTTRTIRAEYLKEPDLDKKTYSPDKPPSISVDISQPYPIPVAIGTFTANLTIMSDQLLGFLEEIEVKSEDMFTGMNLAALAGINIKELKNKRIHLFLPHSCCFWDLYWQGGSVHFYVPEHADEVMEKYFPPDVLNAIKEMCDNSHLRAIFGGILGARALTCPLFRGGRNYSLGVFFWHKGNWINKNAIYPLFSYGRFFYEKLYGKNKTANNFEPPEDEDQERILELMRLYRKKNRFHSAMVQDFYFAFSFINKGKLFKKDSFTLYFDFADPVKKILKDEKNPSYYNYRYLSTYSLTPSKIYLEEGRWNHLGFHITLSFNYPDNKVWLVTPVKSPQEFPQGTSDENGKGAFLIRIFKNDEKEGEQPGIPVRSKLLYGTMQSMVEKDWVEVENYLPEPPSNYVNPGLRFGEYLKRGYAKTDRPIFDPYLYGYASSQSTYDEIYIYAFDKETLEQKLDAKLAKTLFKAGRYYPAGGSFTINDNFWKTLSYQHSLLSIQTNHFIPRQITKNCSLAHLLHFSNKSLPLKMLPTNLFLSRQQIPANSISKLEIKLDCKNLTPPLLESPFIDSIFIFTSSGIKEVFSSKEIKDVSY